MAENWALKCRSMPRTGDWDNYPAAWQDSVDPAQAYCDASFANGSAGHGNYLWYHDQVINSWLRDYPGCVIDKQV
ncbi:hypothetical protein CSOJ01_12264 [Colletotrichum sojae]|uniref:Uncharacterized protein n=1 Tax=Colletotrichum sojae TaxID=2175907 RepID=A0A8H6IW39_9PEZI|nr:hypothetical protein CSOJ01_12264 [Colletotrichum sojae]